MDEHTIEAGDYLSFMDLHPSIKMDGLKIMEALSNEDSVNIFFYAENGIESSTTAIKALGLTQKRYYTRLKSLLEAGIIEKTDEGYQHTILGKLVYKLGLSLLKIIEKKEQLEVLNAVQKSSSISPEDTSHIAKALSVELSFLDVTGKVIMIDSYEGLVNELNRLIEGAKRTFYIASKYADANVVEVTMKAQKRGIKILILTEKLKLKNNISMIKYLLSPKLLMSFSKFMSDFTTILRQLPDLIYSFSIIDGKIAVFEIPHPNLDSFYLAFIIENEETSKKIEGIFLDMWENAEPFKFL